MAGHASNRHHWIFGFAALAVWLAMGWPFIGELVTGSVRGSFPVRQFWLLPFTVFGAAVVGATVLRVRPARHWALLGAQFAAVLAMTVAHPKDLMSIFLVIIAWQVAMATTPGKALAWVACQTLAIVVTLELTPNAFLSYIMVLSSVLQLCCVLTAQAVRREAEAARTLAQTNRELRAAQAIIANRARDAERLRISRELHDAWGHELTALGLQLEIASKVDEPERANDHVVRAKGLSRALLTKVRDVVAALREIERDEGGSAVARNGAGVWAQGDAETMPTGDFRSLHQRIFPLAVLAVSAALALPVLQMFLTGMAPASTPWLVALALFATAGLVATVSKPRPALHWALLGIQVAAVVAMAFIASWAMMAVFLIVVAWQVALATGPGKALAWVAVQTLAVVAALALAARPDLCWVLGVSVALQLFFVFAAQALRKEANTARALAQTNGELRTAQAIIASNVRDAERLRISRELHDSWGHELTALGLQLEIASHVAGSGRAKEHVAMAKSLAGDLLGKVRDVVSTLDEAERRDLKSALEAFARGVPTPAIHVDVAPGVQVGTDQACALMRCAQEAVTNAVKHADAENLWLQVTKDAQGVRLVARNDGRAKKAVSSPGVGLVGMRERLEALGGRLAVKAGAGSGFTVDAWLPTGSPQPA